MKKTSQKGYLQRRIDYALECHNKGKELLAFIEREPVMKYLLAQFDKRKVTCDGVVGDNPPPIFLEISCEQEGKSWHSTVMVYFGDDDGYGWTDDEQWYVRDGRSIESTLLGQTLGAEAIKQIVKVCKLSGHDVAEAERMFR